MARAFMAGKVLIICPGPKPSISLRAICGIESGKGWHCEEAPGVALEQCQCACQRQRLLVRTKPLLAMIESPWGKFLSVDARGSEMVLFRKHERTGRPIGDDAFIERLERLLDRELKPKKPGPKAIDK
jgi:hypothetical protein